MASKIKADQFETLDGSGNITLNNSVTMASTKTLPAASLTGTVPTASLGSGTASSSVFLRGDGSWQAAGSTSASDLSSGTLAKARVAAGSVIQVTQGNSSTAYDTTSTTAQAGPVSQTMTLNNSSNKILVCFNFLASATKGASYCGGRYSIYRGGNVSGTRLTLGTEPQLVGYDTEQWAWQSLWYLDTPGGNTNYCLGFWSHPAGGNARIRGSHGYTTMTLMEIQA